MWKLWPLGKIFGVELKIHGTFMLLLAFFALSGFFQGGALQAGLSLALGLVLFLVVILHEFGHILAAKHFGIPSKDIILSPLGGIARGQGLPKKPSHEMAIAAAGPAVNLVLAGVTYLGLQAIPWTHIGPGGGFAGSLMNWFFTINVVLALFNLIPALPMDGGRILRAALTHKMGYLRATQTAAKVARWTTLAMAIYAISTGHFTLLLIAGAVFVLSWMEIFQAHVKQAQAHPMFQAFGGAGGGRGHTHPHSSGGGVVVDQDGNVVGGHPRAGWSSVENVRPTQDSNGWSVQSARWLDSGPK